MTDSERAATLLNPTSRGAAVRRGLIAFALMSICALNEPNAGATPPPYSIDFHIISSGGSILRNGCYTLSGTLGQTAPGYSSVGIYSLFAGYWQTIPTAMPDEIFFNGFEEC
jgi:hypothetical protein